MTKLRWRDLAGWQKGLLVGAATIQVSLLGAALWDIAHRKPEELCGDRRLWAALAFVNWIGPISYFCLGRRRPSRRPTLP